MTTGDAPLRFRPPALPELLDELFRLYRRRFKVIAGASLAVVLPGVLLSFLSGSYRVDFGFLSDVLSHANDPEALRNLQGRRFEQVNAGWAALAGLVGVILVPFTVGAVYRATTAVAVGTPVTIGSVLRGTLSRYWGLFGVAVLPGVALVCLVLGLVIVAIAFAIVPALLLLFFLLVPAAIALTVFVAIRWALAIPALLTESIGPVVALRRSWNLVRGQWWRTLGILIVVFLMQLVAGIVVGALLGGLAFLIPGLGADPRAALTAGASTVVNAVVTPIAAIAITLLYFDLRVRKEGFGL